MDAMAVEVSFGLSEQVVIVTGAGRGIGRATALAAAEAGASVAIASRNLGELQALADEIKSAGGMCFAQRADVKDLNSLESLVAAVLKEFGRIDGLVNNAGDNIMAPAFDYDEAQFDHLVAVNFKSVFFLSRMVAQQLIAQGSPGSIVNVSSQAGLVGAPGRAPYSGAKAAVINLTRTFAAEWGQYGIRVNSVAPTFTRTPLAEAALAKDPLLEPAVVAKILLGRIAEPEEIAAPIVFLLSSASSMVTGQTLAVDGGWTAT
ncbi:MAG TPA: SDR family oxidoreductase [Acidimicrobiales bacterium]|nr:SDR family oxidoreductase [Acidimicrobiales bacterium]